MTPKDTDKDPRTHGIIGAAIEVHNTLGHGFIEAVYQDALAIEMAARDIPFQREVEVGVKYKGRPLRCTYKADFVCHDDVIVELKAIAAVGGPEQAQVLNDLKATGLRLGLLLNFGASLLEVRRLVFDPPLMRRTANPQMTPMNTDKTGDRAERRRPGSP